MFKVVQVEAISQNLCFFNSQGTCLGGLSIGKSEPTKRQRGSEGAEGAGGLRSNPEGLALCRLPSPSFFLLLLCVRAT